MRRIRNFMPQIQAKHWFFALLMAGAACSPAASPAHSKATSQGATSQGDSGAADGTKPETFRAFRKPPKHSMPAATKEKNLPKGDSCRTVSSAVYNTERIRLVAALDATMRSAGGLVLPLRSHIGLTPQSREIGHEFRGPKGERLMIVGQYNECSTPPPYVLTADYEIFAAYPKAVGKKKRVINACMGDCGGCGMQTPDVPAIAEVPEGSRVVQSREVDVPMATEVVFMTKEMCMPRP